MRGPRVLGGGSALAVLLLVAGLRVEPARAEAPSVQADAAAPGTVVRLGGSSLRLPEPHSQVAFSPAADRLAVETSRRRFRLWSMSTREVVEDEDPRYTDSVALMRFDPSGRFLALHKQGCEAGRVELVDLASGQVEATVAAEGDQAVSSGIDEDSDEEYQLVLTACASPPHFLALSRGAQHLVVGGRAGPFNIASRGAWDRPWTVPPTAGEPQSATFSPDGKHLVLVDDRGGVQLADLQARTARKVAQLRQGYWRVALSTRGDRLFACAGRTCIARRLDDPERRDRNEWTRRDLGDAPVLEVAPTGELLVAGRVRGGTKVSWLHPAVGVDLGPSYTIAGRVRDLEFEDDEAHGLVLHGLVIETRALGRAQAEGEAAPPLVGHAEEVQALAFTPDGRYLISADDSKVVAWDTETWTTVGTWAQRRQVRGLCPNEAGTRVYVAEDEGLFRLDLPGLGVGWSLPLDGPSRVLVTPDEARAAVRRTSRELLAVGLGPEAEVEVLRKLDWAPYHLAMGQDGRRVLHSYEKGVVEVRGAPSMEVEGELRMPDEWVYALSVSPDSRWGIVGIQDRGQSAELWDLDQRIRVRRVAQASSGGTPQGFAVHWPRQLIAFKAFRKLRLMRFDAEEPLRVLEAGGTDFEVAAFSRDGRWLATGTEDGTVLVWDVDALLAPGPGPEDAEGN